MTYKFKKDIFPGYERKCYEFPRNALLKASCGNTVRNICSVTKINLELSQK